MWSEFQNGLKWGDTLNVAIAPNLGTADSVSLTADLTLNAQNTTRVQLAVNQWNYKALGVGYREQLQGRPNYLSDMAAKCVYSVALAIDTYIAALFTSLTAGNVGTAASAITDDVLLAAVENLNKADVSDTDRHLLLDPESVTDILKIDKMTEADYVNRGAVENPVGGLIGRSRYGCTVWMSNNLKAHTSYHWAGMFQREALATIIQKESMVDMFDWKEKFTNVVRAQAIFGAAASRPTAGCCINTRS